MTIPVGMDLGTTFSVVAHLLPDGRPVVIPNTDGSNTTPSIIAWENGKVEVGAEARELQEFGVPDVATFFKRAMGTADWSLNVGDEEYSAPRLSSLILKHMKDTASSHLGETVTRAVITVPAYFMNVQREATMEAAGLAGITPLSIINEPTAAALAYGVRANRDGGIALVYDLGGGTFDVSLVEISEHELRVIGTDGNHELGGKDWDDRLIGELASRFHADFGEDPAQEALQDLLVNAEALKKALSQRDTAGIRIAANGQTGNYQVSRGEFEDLSRDLIELTRALTERVLEAANVKWRDVTHVVPVGGSTRMPMVQQLLTEMSGKQPVTGVHPDEAVALGAAIKAAMDLEVQEPAKPKFLISGRRNIVDVMSHSLGMIVASEDNSRYENSHIIRRNQPIPAQETKQYRLPLSQRREGKLDVFVTQGELPDPQACTYLNVFAFTGIPKTGAKHADIDVTYAYDANGVAQVSAVDAASGTPLILSREALPEDVPARFALSPADSRAAGEATIYLVFDVSGSMYDEPIRLAKEAAKAFVKACDLGAIKIGIMRVSDSTGILTTPSSKGSKIYSAIDGLNVGDGGGGNSADPFVELKQELGNFEGARFAVVLADGVWSNQALAVSRAAQCHEAGIDVIGVGFGGADKEFLRKISSADMDVFTDLSKLTETFTTIAQEIGSSSPSTGGLRRRK